jgi:hypothetical protein
MLKAIRTRIRTSPATVIASLALVFAMTGGAYAAGKYLITSTKQIKPSVLKQLKGAAGKNGTNGTAGASGAAGAGGPQGPSGPAGPGGPGGPAGAKGENGKPGANGKEGSPWTAGGTLPSGSTETGAWSLQSGAENSGNSVFTPISFSIPLEAGFTAANVFFVKLGDTTHQAECPGIVAAPAATPGHLCVYAQELGGLTPFESGPITDPSKAIGTAGSSAAGALLILTAESAQAAFAYGTWAVTAP